jgi:xanthine dehydrogenase accessory factor
MLIRKDGSILGSVGGGCVEAEVWQVAKTVLKTGRGEMVKYSLTDDDAEAEGLICGGTVEIFVEPIQPEPEIYILGAGHLGQSIANLGHQLGYRISVLDDRESFASSERFPTANRVIVDSFDSGLGQLDVTAGAFVLVVTRGHKHDQIALEAAIQTPASYVGMVGSRRKIQILVENLLEKGVPRALFEKLYAPIGLEIGSETPDEIAISVIAEIIAIRRGVHKRSQKQDFVIDLLSKAGVEG